MSVTSEVPGLAARLAPPAGTGSFRVERPTSRWWNLVATLLRLPRSGDGVPLRLQVTPTAHGHRWTRAFDGRRLVSEQWLEGDDLCERVGPVTLQFAVADDGEVISLVSRRMALGWGRRRIWCPPRVVPEVVCRVAAVDGGGHEVSVSVATPSGQLLCRYSGVVRPALDRVRP